MPTRKPVHYSRSQATLSLVDFMEIVVNFAVNLDSTNKI